VTVFDTTLRDGEQAPGNALSPDAKVRVGLELERLGVDVIEVGFPAASKGDMEAARKLAGSLTSARIATFARSNPRDIESSVLAAGTARHQIQLLATASDLHLERKRGISRASGIREVTTALRHARSMGVTDLSVGLEDASRGAPDLLRALIVSAVEEGATTLVVADTSGCLLPGEYAELIAAIRTWVPPSVVIATHCHDDMGLALANALAGVSAGADQVQTTLGAVGERAGNTALEELAAVLRYKADTLGVQCNIRTPLLYQAYQQLEAEMRLPATRNKSVVGANAFATSAGIHQDGLLADPSTYEYLEPEAFGRRRSILVGRHSGRSVIRHLLESHQISVDDEELDAIYDKHVSSRVDADVESVEQFTQRIVKDGYGMSSRYVAAHEGS
jgi:2-isopropylmalate synthase